MVAVKAHVVNSLAAAQTSAAPRITLEPTEASATTQELIIAYMTSTNHLRDVSARSETDAVTKCATIPDTIPVMHTQVSWYNVHRHLIHQNIHHIIHLNLHTHLSHLIHPILLLHQNIILQQRSAVVSIVDHRTSAAERTVSVRTRVSATLRSLIIA